MSKPILCVDFDGVLHSYDSGWQGAETVMDGPVKGALAWLERCLEHFDVQIYSSRTAQTGGVAAMRGWLHHHAMTHFKYDYDTVRSFMEAIRFPLHKPAAFLTVDDRALTFNGDFAAFDPAQLAAFKPWNKREERQMAKKLDDLGAAIQRQFLAGQRAPDEKKSVPKEEPPPITGTFDITLPPDGFNKPPEKTK